MSKSTHTPGPLVARPTETWPFDIEIVNSIGQVVDRIRLPASSTMHRNFAEAMSCVGFSGDDIDHCRDANKRALADAHLRAAAPELLGALKAATDALAGGLWDFSPGQDEHEKCELVINDCRAAILKAEGKQ